MHFITPVQVVCYKAPGNWPTKGCDVNLFERPVSTSDDLSDLDTSTHYTYRRSAMTAV